MARARAVKGVLRWQPLALYWSRDWDRQGPLIGGNLLGRNQGPGAPCNPKPSRIDDVRRH